MIKSKILDRLDVSNEFWKQFEVQNVTISIFQFFEKLKNRDVNKKHKGVKRGTSGMMFENYAQRIKRLRHDLDQSEPIESITQ